MFSFETLIYGCLMFIVPLHCCQNLTLPNVEYEFRIAGQQGPIRTLTAALKRSIKTLTGYIFYHTNKNIICANFGFVLISWKRIIH